MSYQLRDKRTDNDDVAGILGQLRHLLKVPDLAPVRRDLVVVVLHPLLLRGEIACRCRIWLCRHCSNSTSNSPRTQRNRGGLSQSDAGRKSRRRRGSKVPSRRSRRCRGAGELAARAEGVGAYASCRGHFFFCLIWGGGGGERGSKNELWSNWIGIPRPSEANRERFGDGSS